MPNHALAGTSAAREWDARGALAVAAVLKKPGLGGGGGGGGGPNVPVIFTSDLVNGPKTGGSGNNGLWVTLYGRFGPGPHTVTLGGGAVASVLSYTAGSATQPDRIVVQLGAAVATGNFVVQNGEGLSSSAGGCLSKPIGTSNDFTVRAGNIYFVSASGSGSGTLASPMSPTTAVQTKNAGDTFYFRGGSYSGNYGNSYGRNFAIDLSNSGSANNHVAWCAYPGETPTFSLTVGAGRESIVLGQDTGTVHHFVLANLTIRGDRGGISHGGNTNAGASAAEQFQSGASNVRVIGCDIRSVYTAGVNTMSGSLTMGGNYCQYLCNYLHDTGLDPSVNNNHMVYIQCGSSYGEVAWNDFSELQMGHTLQVHTDPTFDQAPWTPGAPAGHVYTDLRIHSNWFRSSNPDYCRAVNIGNVGAGTTTEIDNNCFDNVGQNVAVIVFGLGHHKVRHNTIYRPKLPATGGYAMINQWGPNGTCEVRNNICFSDGTARYIGASDGGSNAQITASHNLYFNNGAPFSGDTSPVTGDPLFTNAAALDFTLQAGSPALNAGTLLAAVALDRNGNPRPQGAAPDIGAHERAA